MSFSFRVVSDQSLIGSGVASGRTEIVSECVKLMTNRVGANDRHDSHVQLTTPFSFVIHCSYVPPQTKTMTDRDIVGEFNGVMAAQQRLIEDWDRTVTEIPPGNPQIEHRKDCDQWWVPRGEVLRCIADDGGPDGEVTIHIDNEELSLAEFGALPIPCRLGHADRVRSRGTRHAEPKESRARPEVRSYGVELLRQVLPLE